MRCLYCDSEFQPRTVIQRYCSKRCSERHHKEYIAIYPSITFQCAQCGRKVVTEPYRTGQGGRPDMRTRFCCHSCEKNYWKHSQKETDKHGADRRTNFHSFADYVRYEKRTNTI